jgi:hypothetical protein
MSREQKVKEFGLEIVEADEAYWKSLGYSIDYKHDRLVKES